LLLLSLLLLLVLLLLLLLQTQAYDTRHIATTTTPDGWCC
jgi:hypothetical protein